MMESTEFRHLYDVYYPDVLHFVQGLLSVHANQADVDDVVQNVFIKVALKADQFRRESKWKTWLFAIARNTVIDHQRQIGRQAARQSPSLSEEVFMDRGLMPVITSGSYGNLGAGVSWNLSMTVEKSSRMFEPDPSANPEETTIRLEEQAEVRACIDELPLPMKAVIICRLHAGLSIAETATIMNWSQGKVRVTYSRALRKFKEVWERRYS